MTLIIDQGCRPALPAWKGKTILSTGYFSDGNINLAGEIFVIPRGTEHKPFAEKEARILIIEPVGVVNTGDEKSSKTAADDVWI